ncbi:GreA/GreB family elongation factor [Polaromonas sp.]|uniref:GreA/GreB family elongation factor n=1 Tax=Polaromonas sp. TaxID=1869339 RepID=UPI00286A8106|nr:GreA/GreB family elongation factor [Polaromonas sp.]
MNVASLQPSPSPSRTLTELDHIRITNLLRHPASRAGSLSNGAAPAVHEVIDAADLVSSHEVAPNVVTMYSQVLIADGQTGEQRKLTLCYPHDAEPAAGFVSVLSPAGAGLLGLSVGQVARWTMPQGGGQASAEILALLFQPEDSGDYLL